MSQSWQRRMGVLLVVVLLLTAVLVPSVSAAPVESRAAAGSAIVSAGSGWNQCAVYHWVKRGENLTQIARKYGVSIGQLQQWNNIWNPNLVYAGTSLVIWKPCKPAPQPKPKPRPQPHPVPCVPGCQPVPPPSGPWQASYYNNRDMSGSPVLQRMEGRPNYNWGWGSPAPQVNPDNFSARWTTSSNALGGCYRMTIRVDDGVRVYVDGNLVFDSWMIQSVRVYEQDIILPAGMHYWTIEYVEAEGVAEFGFSTRRLY